MICGQVRKPWGRVQTVSLKAWSVGAGDNPWLNKPRTPCLVGSFMTSSALTKRIQEEEGLQSRRQGKRPAIAQLEDYLDLGTDMGDTVEGEAPSQ